MQKKLLSNGYFFFFEHRKPQKTTRKLINPTPTTIPTISPALFFLLVVDEAWFLTVCEFCIQSLIWSTTWYAHVIARKHYFKAIGLYMIHKVLPGVALMAEIEGTLGRYTTSSFGSLKETLRPRIVGDLRPCVLCNKLRRFLIRIAFSR